MDEWGETRDNQDRREEIRIEDCIRCKKYDNCDRSKDREHYERYCMNMGEGCDGLYKPTKEERRMDI
jgi:hypothetical protein